MNIRCKHCGGTLYEEEIYWDDNDTKFQQLGCYTCSKKVTIEFVKWLKFKNQLAKVLRK